jgi:hypothetical protein
MKAPWFRWWVILAATAAGLFTPLPYQGIATAALYFGYVGCHRHSWSRYQLFIAYLLGGLSFGAGLQLAAILDRHGHSIFAAISPLLLWLIARAIFLAFEKNTRLSNLLNPPQ